MTQIPPPAARLAAASAPELSYTSLPSRAHTCRLVAGVAGLAAGCGGMFATLLTVWATHEWFAANAASQIMIALTHHSIEFLGRLAIALFGLALLRRSPRAWQAAVAFFSVRLINPLLAAVLLPFAAAARLRTGGSPEAYWILSGYLSAAADGLPPLLVLALLTRPLVHEMIEQWSRGDGPAARR